MLNDASDKNQGRDWKLEEACFNERYQAKWESILALGNGYLGLRSATEEPYIGQTRNLFVAGTYDKFDETEATELPNAADLTEMLVYINDELFSLKDGKVLEYSRKLNLKTGELTRRIVWETPKSERYQLTFGRFVSRDDRHLIGIKVEIVPLTALAGITIKTGINGRQTNSGVQHFHDGQKRVYENQYMQLIQTTLESEIHFVMNSRVRLYINNREVVDLGGYSLERRSIYQNSKISIDQGETLTIEKMSNVFTSLDRDDGIDYRLEDLVNHSLEHIKEVCRLRYDSLLEKSKIEWQKYWEEAEIEIQTDYAFDQLAVRFAQYHLLIMTPFYDERFSIGAKALTGEGYKGHVFWDTEIFILPYFQYTFPAIAQTLLKYRYNTIEGARNKAKQFGYSGAMYPWESALSGEEETPEWAAINIMTGKAARIWSGLKEHHVTADIGYAVWDYFLSTTDEDFMNEVGGEIIFECAEFWCSRLEWSEIKQEYHINDVIGPDEYTEHINNNAYTNYMAEFTIRTAIQLYELGMRTLWSNFEHIKNKLHLEERIARYKVMVNKIYLPQPDAAGIIPQDDSFMSKDCINLEKYKSSAEKQTILKDYTREQVVDLQVLKQADVVMLLYVLRNRFPSKVKQANWEYYEKRTIHDSSLSAVVHSIAANDFGSLETAYGFFQKAAQIDLGPNPVSSNDGIHAAAMGGIWLAVVMGFGGVSNDNGTLHLEPKLPEAWERLSFNLWWRGEKVHIDITKTRIKITKASGTQMDLMVRGKRYTLLAELTI